MRGNRADRGAAALQPSLVVLQSVPAPRPTTNPYVVMLIDSLRNAGAIVRPFSWRGALSGGYDVFHVHWPENLVRGSTPLRTLARQAAMLAVLLRLRLSRTPIVRTLHNIGRHEQTNRRERWIMHLFDRWTTYGIAINAHTSAPPGLPVAVILHGHYRDWYSRFPQPEPVPGRIAYVGLIRAYKGVEALVSAFRGLSNQSYSLTVSGRPRTDEIAEDLRRRAGDDPRVLLELEYVSDARLAEAVAESQVVVLPYREMHNSGAALAALSLDRPVLVPDNEINAALAREVGADWVVTFAGEPTTELLWEVLEARHGHVGSARPDLSARDWTRAGESHLQVYRKAIALRRS